jgi:hypothetical protein
MMPKVSACHLAVTLFYAAIVILRQAVYIQQLNLPLEKTDPDDGSSAGVMGIGPSACQMICLANHRL